MRVAISGIGMVTPCGADRESSWHGLVAGNSVLRWLTEEEHAALGCDISRTRIAGAPAARPEGLPLSAAANSVDWMSRAAAYEALEDADLKVDAIDRQRCGLVLGTSKGNLAASQRAWSQSRQLLSGSELWLESWPNAAAMAVAADLNLQGPVLVPVAACATGMLSICRGVELIQHGHCDVVLAGSVDDSLSEMLWASYRRLGVLARLRDIEPGLVCRPFDLDRQGFLMGSGAAIVVLERLDAVESRGHQPYAEWLAGGHLSDSYALTQVAPDAAGLTRLIQDVLRRGDVVPDDVDYINLHGTGTKDNDRYETRGIRQALGSAAESIPCSSLKGTIGHLLGGAGSVEFAAMLLAMRDGIVPPTANLMTPDAECGLDCTPRHAKPHTMTTALKLSLGFGGHLVAGLVRNCRS